MELTQKMQIVLIFFLLFLNIFLLFSNPRISGLFILEPSVNAPHDFISEDQIKVYDDKIILEIENYSLSKYSFTKSMLPIFDSGANGVGIKPKSPEDLNVGDIITFRQDGNLIVHRIIEKGIDEQGWYFITKGDNNNLDDGKIRFHEVDSVLVALIY